jgi:purine-binding chemotaxis protein CheW
MAMCSVRAGDGVFGIDTREIREVLGSAEPQRVPLAARYIAGVLAYRGEVLTTVSLRALLGLAPWAGKSHVLVLEDADLGERFGLMVDGVDGMVAVPESGFDRNPATLDARAEAILCGVCRMETGLMARLDPQRLRPLELARGGIFGAMRAKTGEAG